MFGMRIVKLCLCAALALGGAAYAEDFVLEEDFEPPFSLEIDSTDEITTDEELEDGQRAVLSVGAGDEVIMETGGMLSTTIDEGLDLVLNGGSLTATGNSRIDDEINLTLNNVGSSVVVNTGATLEVSGTFTQRAGTTTVNGTLLASDMTLTGGGLAVNGTLSGGGTGAFALSGGSATIVGIMQNYDEIAVSGNGVFIIDNGKVIGAVSQSGGSVAVQGTGSVDTLAVSGGAVSMSDTGTIGSLSMSGGTMTIASGNVQVTMPGELRNSVWEMNGGTVQFGEDAEFTGGAINANVTGGGIAMTGGAGNNSLTISGGLNARSSMTITMNGGDFTLTPNGSYYADYGTMITVDGAGTFTVAKGLNVSLDLDIIQNYVDGVDTLLLAATNATTITGTAEWIDYSSNSAEYTYQVIDDGGGAGGLYLTNVRELTRAEKERNLLDEWRQNPRVGDQYGALFNNSFVNAVIDGDVLARSQADFDNLDASGKFNATQLFNIMNAGVGYDALMLYNGASLTAANDAALNVNSHLLRRVADRAGVIRREVIVDELEQPATVNEAEAEDVRLYGDPAATRLWAEGLVYSDSAGGGDGFAGYDYSGRGLMIGADKRENDIWYGAALAYVDGGFEDKASLGGDSGIDSYAALVHAGWQGETGLYVTGTLGYAYADNALRDNRALDGTIGVNEADFGTHSLLTALEAGQDIQLGEYLIVTPSAGLRYVTAWSGAHEQWFRGNNGSAAVTLDAGKVTGSSLSVPLNLGLSMDVIGDEDSLLSVTGRVGYAYELQNKAARGEFTYGGLGGVLAPVTAAARKPGRHTWNLGLSARYLYDDMEFGLGYEFLNRDHYTSHSLTFSAGVNF